MYHTLNNKNKRNLTDQVSESAKQIIKNQTLSLGWLYSGEAPLFHLHN